MLLVYLVVERLTYLHNVDRYGKMYENIYIVSNHPESEEEVFIEAFDQFIVNAPYRHVKKAGEEEKRWLTESKNTCFCDPGLLDHQRLQIIPIIFQDGIHVNENFKEFKKRVKAEIKVDRADRHALLKNTDPIWYDQFSNLQEEISWFKK